MELLLLATLVAFAAWTLKSQDQGRRIALLGAHLAKYQIEKHMETLTQGYMRALGEQDPQRREQIWELLRPTERSLCSQVERFAADFSLVPQEDARVSKLPIYLPAVTKLPAASFDMREALAIHARGISRAVEGGGYDSARARAFSVSAELFLMQHTCHWFCKSRTIASARMLGRHKTSYQQLIQAVAPATRVAYCVLVGGE